MSATERPRVVLVNRCFVRREDGKLLAIRRAMADEHYPGKWEVPGGKLDMGQDLLRAQEREVMEETGYLVAPLMPLVYADSHLIGDGRYAGLPYVVLFSITRLLGGKFALSAEHCGFTWVSCDELLDLDLTPEVWKAAIVLREHLI